MFSAFSTPVGRFRFAAVAEAVSWAGLLIGMYFKYFSVQNPIGVQIMGPIHGALFLLYLVFTVQAMIHLRASRTVLIIGLIAAVPPFTTLWFEYWVLKRHRPQR